MSTKKCTKCQQEKQQTDFYAKRTWCKKCMIEYQVKYDRLKYQVDPVFRQAKINKVMIAKGKKTQREELEYALLNKAILDEAQLSQCSAQLQCI